MELLANKLADTSGDGRFVTWAYRPKPDITAHELARLMPALLGGLISEADWASLGEACTRHLERTHGYAEE